MNPERLWLLGLPEGGAKVERMRLAVARLPEGLLGARILFLADVHAGFSFPDAAVERLIGQIAGLVPDMILWGGDFAETRRDAERLFQAAGRLTPRLGMAAVVGNNDRRVFRDSLSPLRSLSERAGIRLLVNERWTIPVSGGGLTILGLDENYYGTPDASILNGARGREPEILLAHSPAPLEKLLAGKALPDLILCGHTHGGQVRLMNLTPYNFFFDGVKPFGQRFFTARGVVREDGATVVVTAGLGSSKIPIRINCPPEMQLITLEKM